MKWNPNWLNWHIGMKTRLFGIPREISRSLDNSLTVYGVAERTLGQLALCKCQMGFQAGLQTPAAGLQLRPWQPSEAGQRPTHPKGPLFSCPLCMCVCSLGSRARWLSSSLPFRCWDVHGREMFHRDRDLHPENPKDRIGPLGFYVKPLAPNFSEVFLCFYHTVVSLQ